ncbi:single-stranded DNA-binding protein [Lacrimispora amygdalina]|uniref:Single-stranded DNA-binding protein n=1 Tax=Lacrimispora amygdalina TaxID=253257 RepID=A0A3E2N8S7_9FIRM|nr:single-stranded DNA-binding protein [Clostridium indicum]RFZ77344.1 single-stranded DNA-binding protein [Clostridium indicum]
MNNVQLVGRLTRDPEVRYSDGGSTVARFTLAVDRRFHKEGQQDADFISCVAFGKTAEFIEKYFSKGMRMGLIGRIQTGSYTNQEGQKIYTTDIYTDNVEFVESKGSSENGQGESRPEPSSAGDGFMHIPDDVGDEGLPFN